MYKLVTTMALSDAWLRSTAGKEQEKILVKSDRDGLSVRVSLKGKITYQFRYRWGGKSERVDIGSYPAMSLKDARDAVIKIKGDLEANKNPRVSKRIDRENAVLALSVESVIRGWYDTYCLKNKKSPEQIIRSFEIHIFPKIGSLPHDETNLHTWLKILENLMVKSPAIAERVLINAKQAHRWAARRQLTTALPLSDFTAKDLGVEKNIVDRVLTNDEIKIVFDAIENSRMTAKNGLFVKLCLLFGCRSSELRLSKLTDFDFNNMIWTVPPENHKTGKSGKPLIRPIIPAAKEMIEEAAKHTNSKQWLFSNSGDSAVMGKTAALSLPYNIMQYARRKLGIDMPHWTIHDLRRTARTNFSDLTQPHIAEIMLGHKLPGVWQVYDKSDYLDEQRKAYGLWWARIESIVYGEGKVTVMRMS